MSYLSSHVKLWTFNGWRTSIYITHLILHKVYWNADLRFNCIVTCQYRNTVSSRLFRNTYQVDYLYLYIVHCLNNCEKRAPLWQLTIPHITYGLNSVAIGRNLILYSTPVWCRGVNVKYGASLSVDNVRLSSAQEHRSTPT